MCNKNIISKIYLATYDKEGYASCSLYAGVRPRAEGARLTMIMAMSPLIRLRQVPSNSPGGL